MQGILAVTTEKVYEVVWPEAKWHGKEAPPVPRLDTLAGKTILEVGSGFGSDKIYPILEELLKDEYPGMKFLAVDGSSSETAAIAGVPVEVAVDELANRLKATGAHAAISGVGG